MPDISLNIIGNSSTAQNEFNSLADATRKLDEVTSGLVEKTKSAGQAAKESTPNWLEKALAFEKVKKAIVDFTKESIHAYAESERVSKQLTRATGELSEAFETQAQVIGRKLSIDDDLIKTQQILLAQWGAAPKDIEAAVLAINDYAAATGKDAVSATQLLIKNIETGSGVVKDIGVEFDVTGDKAEDLRGMIVALSEKVGGAAGADADTLAGRTRAAALAWDDLKKAFGSSLAEAEAATGAVDKIARALRGIPDAVRTSIAGIKGFFDAAIMKNGVFSFGNITAGLDAALDKATALKFGELSAIEEMKKKLGGGANPNNVLVLDEMTVTGKHDYEDRGGSSGHQSNPIKDAFEANDKELKASQKEAAEKEEAWTKLRRDAAHAVEIENEKNHRNELAQIHASSQLTELESKTSNFDQMFALQDEQDAKEAAKQSRKVADAAKKIETENEQKWAQAGAAIGGALTSSIQQQLAQLADGGEFDVGQVIVNVVAAALAVAGTAIGAAAYGPVGGQIGGAIGSLAGMGIQYAYTSSKPKKNAKKYHDGGWIDSGDELPRFHSGSWIQPDEQMAILQRGERVLSRQEVGNMGGKTSVDSQARGSGGPAIQLNISALDSRSFQDSITSDGGRGMFLAIKSGRGDMARIFQGAIR